jgi:nucleoid-associated protein YgaU
MYQNEISELPKLKDERYENIFKVFQDKDNSYFYNLLETINFPDNLPDGIFETYTVQPGDTLPFISYKIFKTINVWWIICLANNIQNPVKLLEPGTYLKIPNINIIRLIIRQIVTQEN